MKNLELLEKERVYYTELRNFYIRRLIKIKKSSLVANKKNTISNLERLVSNYENKLTDTVENIYISIGYNKYL